ncbi:hypothetical protein V6N13_075809 [Hibiscus sabdariffa]
MKQELNILRRISVQRVLVLSLLQLYFMTIRESLLGMALSRSKSKKEADSTSKSASVFLNQGHGKFFVLQMFMGRPIQVQCSRQLVKVQSEQSSRSDDN